MSISVDIFMPVFVGDYLKKTTMLSCEENGAYCLLLFSLWQNEGFLPNDMKKLSRVCKLTQDRFTEIWVELKGFFTIHDGFISNDRLCEEIEKAVKRRESSARNGKNGGRPRNEKPSDNPEITQPVIETKPNDNLDHNLDESSSPSPSPSPLKSYSVNPVDAKASRGTPQKFTVDETIAKVRLHALGKYTEDFTNIFIDYWFSDSDTGSGNRFKKVKHFSISQRMATSYRLGHGRNFTPPSLEEVITFNEKLTATHGAPDIAARFHRRYASQNWMKNGKPMEEYKSTFFTWLENDKGERQ